MARTQAMYGILALVSVVASFALSNAMDVLPPDGLTSHADCGDSLMEPRVGRNLLDLPNGNNYMDPDTGVVYTIWDKPAANAFEAKVNCTRMGQEQPDVTKPGDLFAIQYLSANQDTWVKTNGEDPCTLVTNGAVQRGNVWSGQSCSARKAFACALRKPLEKCGKDSKGNVRLCGPGLKCCGGATCCCASSTCCGSAICCHSGTKCCLGKLGAKPTCKHILSKC